MIALLKAFRRRKNLTYMWNLIFQTPEPEALAFPKIKSGRSSDRCPVSRAAINAAAGVRSPVLD
jgi:hypothetical protein